MSRRPANSRSEAAAIDAVDELHHLVVHGILHLLGFDHEKLTFRHNGVDRRLTDVHGNLIKKALLNA